MDLEYPNSLTYKRNRWIHDLQTNDISNDKFTSLGLLNVKSLNTKRQCAVTPAYRVTNKISAWRTGVNYPPLSKTSYLSCIVYIKRSCLSCIDLSGKFARTFNLHLTGLSCRRYPRSIQLAILSCWWYLMNGWFENWIKFYVTLVWYLFKNQFYNLFLTW